MPFTPTKEQTEAIKSPAKSLVISASAGSGKTTVMIERLVKLIEEGKVQLENVLVLTFTNASSADMKEKLYNLLLKRAAVSTNCSKAILSLPICDICTIDSFCQKLVKTFFYLVGVDPSFAIISPLEEELLLDKTVSDLIYNELQSQNQQMKYLMDLYFKSRSLSTIKNIVLDILKRLNVCFDPESFVDKIATVSYEKDFNKNIAVQGFIEKYKSQLNNFTNMAISLMQEFKQAGFNSFVDLINEFYLFAIKSIKIASLDGVFKQIDEYNEICTKFSGSKIKVAGLSNDEKEIKKSKLTPFFKEVKEFFSDCVLNQLGASNIETLNELLSTNKERVDYLTSLAIKVKVKFGEQKAAKALMDFNEIESTASSLLSLDEVKEKIKSKYKYIFADEYQDVNELQDNLLTNTDIKNNFIVGDAKQSIYGFRLSNPQIFIDKFKDIIEVETADKEVVLLNKNFRSETQILSFVNNVFSKIMTEKTTDIDYIKTGTFVLPDDFNDINASTNVVIINGKDDDEVENADAENFEASVSEEQEGNAGGQNSVFSKAYSVVEDIEKEKENDLDIVEADLIYQNIKVLLEKGVKLSEISILIRSKNESVQKIIKFLRSKDIALAINFKTNLLEESEVVYLHNFLKVISNRYIDSDFSSLMLSPFFNFTAKELATIRAKYKEERFFYNTVLKLALDETISKGNGELDSLQKKVSDFLASLDKYVLAAANLSIKDLAALIVREFDYLQKVDFMIDSDKINVQKYIQKLSSFDNYSLTYFVMLTKTGMMFSGNDEGIASSNREEIKINTIHSSKGLEYNYVFLINAGKMFNVKSLSEPILISNKFGIGLKCLDEESNKLVNNIVYSQIKAEKKETMIAEEIRLLYVALTRAKLGLFVFGKADLKNIEPFGGEFNVPPKCSYLKILLACLNENELNLLADQKSCLSQNANFILADSLDIQQNVKKLVTPQILPLVKDEDVLKIKQFINNSALKSNIQIKLKNSVTGLINEFDKNNKEETAIKIPELTSEENVTLKNQTNAKIGIAYHSFLEKFNFNETNIEKEIERAKTQLLLEQRDLLDDLTLKQIVNDEKLREIIASGEVFKEQKFLFKLNASNILNQKVNDEILVQGIIDLLIKTQDGFIILDYKATKKFDDEIKLAYKPQLELYKLAGEKILQIKCKNMFVYSLFSGKIIEIK